MRLPPIILAAAMLCASSFAHATPITFTWTFNGTGDLEYFPPGAVNFTDVKLANAPITVRYNTDTTQEQTFSGIPGYYFYAPTNYLNYSDASVQFGSGPIEPIYEYMDVVFDQGSPAGTPPGQAFPAEASIENESIEGTQAVAITSDLLKTYNGATAVGPIAGAAYGAKGFSPPPDSYAVGWRTGAGYLLLDSTGPTGTFTATTPASVTPEPSSLALLGTGMLGMVGTMFRRFRR